jgi:hypothetical protein
MTQMRLGYMYLISICYTDAIHRINDYRLKEIATTDTILFFLLIAYFAIYYYKYSGAFQNCL